MATVHIESKKEDIANIVLMPGDPKRAQYIADKFLTDVKLVNSVRGMTAYTGYYKNKRVTVFPSGMGNPSMGIYSYELLNEYDVDYIIRIGSCGAYNPDLKLGDVILVKESYSDSMYGHILDDYKDSVIASSSYLNDVITKTSHDINMKLVEGRIYSSDVFYERNNDYKQKVREHNVLGVEMETFSLFNNARVLGKNVTALLTVSDSFCFTDKMNSEEREKNLNDMIILSLESCLKL